MEKRMGHAQGQKKQKSFLAVIKINNTKLIDHSTKEITI